jgi:small GTP-binding protein
VKTVDLDNSKVKLQIWDTAGQERFRTITTAYYRNAMGVILVYDVTMRESFQNVSMWLEKVVEYANAHVASMLIGNKCDDREKRQVTKEEGMELAEKNGMLFFETSAKLGMSSDDSFTSVDHAFMVLAKNTFDKLREKTATTPITANRGVNLGAASRDAENTKRCC